MAGEDAMAAETPRDPARPGFARTWWVAMRPFALPASTMPVLFGTVLAVTLGGSALSWPRFLAALLGMAVLHTGANLLNDVYDFKKGIDRQVNPVSGAVVRGWVSPREALVAGWLFIAVGSGLGLALVALVGTPVLWLGIAGVAMGVFYTWGPFALKYNAVGDLAVCAAFGVLGALGAWTVQIGTLSWVPAVWAIPIGLLVAGILHANNWRDIQGDRSGGIHTMAGLFGDRGSAVYYAALLFVPYLFVVAWVAASWLFGLAPPMPWPALIVLLSLPLAVGRFRRGLGRKTAADPVAFLALDGATAQLNLAFGLLYTGGLGLAAWTGWGLI